MDSARNKVTYYKQMIVKNQKAFLQSTSNEDKEILAKQIETFRRLHGRFSTQFNKTIKQESLFNS